MQIMSCNFTKRQVIVLRVVVVVMLIGLIFGETMIEAELKKNLWESYSSTPSVVKPYVYVKSDYKPNI